MTVLNLMRYSGSEEARSKLPGAQLVLNEGGPNDESVRVVMADPVWAPPGPDGSTQTLVSPEALAPGWFCLLVSDTVHDDAVLAFDQATGTVLKKAADAPVGYKRIEPLPA